MGTADGAGALARVVVVDAPSNLGLRPPREGCVPGCYKLAGALRDTGLLTRLWAEDGGVVVPPRYVPDWHPGKGVRNAAAIADYARRLADRVQAQLVAGRFPLVLGGDCSILLGPMLALRRRGRYGLAFVDAHSDFRHPGNAPAVGAAAGEDLALATGRGGADLTDLEGLRPLVADADVVCLGAREDDDALDELAAAGIPVVTAPRVRTTGAAEAGRAAAAALAGGGVDGFWVHLDADVLDRAVMPAVDTPEPNGLGYGDLGSLLCALLSHPLAVGLEVTIFDPDLDPAGALASRLADAVVEGVERARQVRGGG